METSLSLKSNLKVEDNRLKSTTTNEENQHDDLPNRPMSDSHLQRVTVCVSYIGM